MATTGRTSRNKLPYSTEDDEVDPALDGQTMMEAVDKLVQPGMAMVWFTAVAPVGWYLLNGQKVSSASNPGLAAIFPTAAGQVTLPNLKDRFLAMAGTLLTLGQSGGADKVALTPAQIATHTHSDGTLSADSHTHTHMSDVSVNSDQLIVNNPQDPQMDWAGSHVDRYDVGGFITGINIGHGASIAMERWGVTSSDASGHGVSGSTGDKNGNGAGTNGSLHENMPPYFVINFIVKGG
jgi:microcystin-dependent protein